MWIKAQSYHVLPNCESFDGMQSRVSICPSYIRRSQRERAWCARIELETPRSENDGLEAGHAAQTFFYRTHDSRSPCRSISLLVSRYTIRLWPLQPLRHRSHHCSPLAQSCSPISSRSSFRTRSSDPWLSSRTLTSSLPHALDLGKTSEFGADKL